MAAKKLEQGNVQIVKRGDQIILPENMTEQAAILWLGRKMEEDEKEVNVHADINSCYPVDGWIAFHKAIKEIYGWSELRPTPGFFGPNPPTMVSVPISLTERAEIPFGNLAFPGLHGELRTNFGWNPPGFVIGGKIKQKDLPQFHRIVDKTKELVKSDSIYKGKAIRLSFQWMRDEDEFNPIHCAPKYMDLSGESNLIFSADVEAAIKVGLFTPIEFTAQCRKYGIPLKRGVLLQGPYGCGKTLTALATARKAVENKWTFIYLDSVLDLAEGLKFAHYYAPCVLFVEDIDKAISQRQIEQDAILNMLDGIDTKSSELLTVFTTNFVDRLDPAFCRPGRLDTIVRVSPPDREAAVRLAQYYGRHLLAEDTDWNQIGLALDGKIPAVIREVVERAKLAAIGRLGVGPIEGHVRHEDLLVAAQQMDEHQRLIDRKQPLDNHELVVMLKPADFSMTKAQAVASASTPVNEGDDDN